MTETFSDSGVPGIQGPKGRKGYKGKHLNATIFKGVSYFKSEDGDSLKKVYLEDNAVVNGLSNEVEYYNGGFKLNVVGKYLIEVELYFKALTGNVSELEIAFNQTPETGNSFGENTKTTSAKTGNKFAIATFNNTVVGTEYYLQAREVGTNSELTLVEEDCLIKVTTLGGDASP